MDIMHLPLCRQNNKCVTLSGYSAAQIQKYKPKTHTIVECCDVVINRLQQFARVHPGVIVVPGTWQQQLVRPTKRKRGPDREEALCTAQSVSKTVASAASNTAETEERSHSLAVSSRKARPPTRSPGWAMRQFDCVFFDDFPLPIADQQLQQQLQSVGSRWDIFLQYCVVNDLLARRARVSGYLARPFVPQYTQGRFQTKMKSMRVHVPANCTYFPYKVAIIPTFTFKDCATPPPTARATSAKTTTPGSEPPQDTRGDHTTNPIAHKRPKLRLPGPKLQPTSPSAAQPSPASKPKPMASARKRPALRLPAPVHGVARSDEEDVDGSVEK